MDNSFENGSSQIKINLKDFSSDAFTCFFEFMYTGTIRNPALQDLDARELWAMAGGFEGTVCLSSSLMCVRVCHSVHV
jgi:hypothetical protein